MNSTPSNNDQSKCDGCEHRVIRGITKIQCANTKHPRGGNRHYYCLHPEVRDNQFGTVGGFRYIGREGRMPNCKRWCPLRAVKP